MVDQEAAISIQSVSKAFKRYARPVDRLKEVMLPGKSYAESFWALEDISLEVFRGQTLGIIGHNGSGKSTLLQIVAGTLSPTQGTVNVKGRVSALLELGSGFNPEFTGRQNVFFNAQILGLSREEVEERFDKIANFAEIGSFIDEPVKTYSSGMYVRLAFAVAIHVDPEVLIVDEALAVGDSVFVHRCMAKIREFQDGGGTILFVSHDVGSISRLCSEAVWLNQGRIVEKGKPAEVCKHYQAWVHEEVNKRYVQQQDSDPVEATSPVDHSAESSIDIEAITHKTTNPFTQQPYRAFVGRERFGTGRGEIVAVELLTLEETPLAVVEPGEVIILRVSVWRHALVKLPNVGVALVDRLRTVLAGWSSETLDSDFAPQWRARAETGHSVIEFKLTWPHLASAVYSLDIAFGDGVNDSLEIVDWLQNAVTIQAITHEKVHGLFKILGTEVKLYACEEEGEDKLDPSGTDRTEDNKGAQQNSSPLLNDEHPSFV